MSLTPQGRQIFLHNGELGQKPLKLLTKVKERNFRSVSLRKANSLPKFLLSWMK